MKGAGLQFVLLIFNYKVCRGTIDNRILHANKYFPCIFKAVLHFVTHLQIFSYAVSY